MHGKITYIKLDDLAGTARDISPDCSSVSLGQSQDVADSTGFSPLGGSHSSEIGLNAHTLEVSGFVTTTTSATSAAGVIPPLRNNSATSSFEYGPDGNASGKLKKSGECLLTSYSEDYSTDAIPTFSASLQVTGAVTIGTF